MVIQYPHTLKTTIVSGGGIAYDENGDVITQPTIIKDMQSVCRAEPNGRGVTIAGVDGQKLEFGFMVYAPLSIMDMHFGNEIQVFDGDTLLVKDKVKRFHRGQLNVRIWV